ncbi:MAG TPA: lasso peptide biosynthesis protein [Acidimicrobiales bacterium]
MPVPTPDDLRAGVWTLRCMARCRHLDEHDVRTVPFPSSARIGPRGGRVVLRLLRDREDKCLSNALIAQAWRSDHGDLVDVVIGVTAPSSGFTAHAWLADAPEAAKAGHQEIHRIPAKARPARA